MDRDIEQAADLTAGRGNPVFEAVRAAITAKVGLFDLDGAKLVTIDELTRAVVAAAVPATAEHIAAAIEKMPDQEYTLAELKAEGFGDDLGVIYRDARGNAAARARSFAAGLSAGATEGDSDE